MYFDPLFLDAMRDALRATPATEAPRARLATDRGPLSASAPTSLPLPTLQRPTQRSGAEGTRGRATRVHVYPRPIHCSTGPLSGTTPGEVYRITIEEIKYAKIRIFNKRANS